MALACSSKACHAASHRAHASAASRSALWVRRPAVGLQRRRAAPEDGGGGAGPQAGGRLPTEFSAYTSVDEWKKLDSKVNKYPCTRIFNTIGASDDDAAFKADMLAAVESVVGPVHVECVSDRPSSGGKYTAVRIGPVHVQSADQVVEIFARIKEAGGSRLKWYM